MIKCAKCRFKIRNGEFVIRDGKKYHEACLDEIIVAEKSLAKEDSTTKASTETVTKVEPKKVYL